MHGTPVIDIRLSQMEPSDLRGIPFRVAIWSSGGTGDPAARQPAWRQRHPVSG